MSTLCRSGELTNKHQFKLSKALKYIKSINQIIPKTSSRVFELMLDLNLVFVKNLLFKGSDGKS